MKKHVFGIAIFLLILILCATAVSANEEVVSVGIPVEEHPELFKARSMPTHGEARIAVFLIEFPDHKNDNPLATHEFYKKIYFDGGYNTSMGKSVADFYNTQSYGKLTLGGEVFDWYTAKHERSYYDNRKAELIMEVGEYYRSTGVDFSKFDGNSDGVIDGIVYHFAGEYSTNRDDAWYTGKEYSNASGFGKIGDMRFTNMAQVYERAEKYPNVIVRTICHELMHSFGMADVYGDTTPEMMGANDLMSRNVNTINPYTKILLGWIDSVRVVTGDVADIKLDLYGENGPGDAVIVTDRFDGLFDEFYMVAYRDFSGDKAAVIWHIDARTTEDGRSFLYQNLYYDARPDKENPHRTKNTSEQLFIEELSADPDLNYSLGSSVVHQKTAFTKDSVLGPDSIPSSDTHDGRYTGIRISDFTEHDDKYLTFDVSFVKDTTAPVATTKGSELSFIDTVKVRFNEYIYAGASFDKIRATDLDGNPIKISALIPHCPHNEVEIIFADRSYEKGYRLIFPDGALTDSSGNSISEIIITSSADGFFFPDGETELPDAEGLNRHNWCSYFFSDGDELVVVTELWVEHTFAAKFEFMRLDGKGNVILQKIVDHPIKGVQVQHAYETPDGHYIFLLANQHGLSVTDALLCFDRNGNIKWANDDYSNSGTYFPAEQVITLDDGLLLSVINNSVSSADRVKEFLFIDSETGAITPYKTALDGKEYASHKVYALYDGKWLVSTDTRRLQLIDAETKEIIASTRYDELDPNFTVLYDVKRNSDGTIMLYHYKGENVGAVLVDATLKKIKSVSLKDSGVSPHRFYWFEDDGFIYANVLEAESHRNLVFHIYRYDRSFELVWENNVEANFVYYFYSSSGDILAYRSMLEPKRECYIDYYGTESARKGMHVHSLVYNKEVAATCAEKGIIDHWQCRDCGAIFSDEGQTPLVDADEILINTTEHTPRVASKRVEPTCTKAGKTERIMCSGCGKIISESKTIYPVGHHIYGEWTLTEAPTEEKDGLKTRICSVCGYKEYKTVKLSDEAEDTTAPVEPSEDEGGMKIAIFASVAVLVFAGGVVAAVVTVRKKRSA